MVLQPVIDIQSTAVFPPIYYSPTTLDHPQKRWALQIASPVESNPINLKSEPNPFLSQVVGGKKTATFFEHPTFFFDWPQNISCFQTAI